MILIYWTQICVDTSLTPYVIYLSYNFRSQVMVNLRCFIFVQCCLSYFLKEYLSTSFNLAKCQASSWCTAQSSRLAGARYARRRPSPPWSGTDRTWSHGCGPKPKTVTKSDFGFQKWLFKVDSWAEKAGRTCGSRRVTVCFSLSLQIHMLWFVRIPQYEPLEEVIPLPSPWMLSNQMMSTAWQCQSLGCLSFEPTDNASKFMSFI